MNEENIETEAVKQMAEALAKSRGEAGGFNDLSAPSNSKPEPNYLVLLEEKKKELIEWEKRLDEKKAEVEKAASDMIMAGRGFAGSNVVEKSKEEQIKEAVNKLLIGTGLNPFKVNR